MSIPRPWTARPLAVAALVVLLAGCDPTDPAGAGPGIDLANAVLRIHADRALVRHPDFLEAPGKVELGLPLVVPSGIGMQLTALAILASGDTVALPADSVAWTSSDATVVSVSTAGFATARSPGLARVRVRHARIASLADSASALALPGYRITDLGFTPTGLNDDGWVVGVGDDGTAWLRDGSTTTGLGSWSPADINGPRAVVGSRSETAGSGDTRVVPVVWRDGVLLDLPLGEFDYAWAHSINDAGTIVGLAMSVPPPDYGIFGVVWRDGRIDTLPAAGPYESIATVITRGAGISIGITRIDEEGVVLGQAGGQAYAWRDGDRTPVDTLRVAFDRNQAGVVVGTIDSWTSLTSLTFTAAAWRPPDELSLHGSGMAMTCFGRPCLTWAALHAINEAGTMVGDVAFYGSEPLVVYPVLPPVRLRALLDLPRPTLDPVPGLCGAAVDINDAGQIIVGASEFDGCRGKVLLEPLPF